MTTRASRRRAWKREELEIARILGGERVPVTGRQRGYAPDIAHRWLAPEVKSRRSPLRVVQTAMDQARKAAAYAALKEGKGKLPIGVYHVVGQQYLNSLVFMTLGDFVMWFGDDPTPGVELPQPDRSGDGPKVGPLP